MGTLLSKVLECSIFGDLLAAAKAIELLWLPRCEAVSLEGGVGGRLLLELGQRIRAGAALRPTEERHV